jgi:S-disulfanyl-L-cysteine oxidoreductase SoxD
VLPQALATNREVIMDRSMGSVLPALLSLALSGALGCGGGDKGGDTTPAASAVPAEGGAPEAAPAGGLSDQLAQGDKVWADSCTTCHGDSGEGKGEKNPALVGGKALGRFKTGGELFEYVKEKMPKDGPGTLSDADYLAATAWLLSKNGKLGDSQDALTAQSAAAISLQ